MPEARRTLLIALTALAVTATLGGCLRPAGDGRGDLPGATGRLDATTATTTAASNAPATGAPSTRTGPAPAGDWSRFEVREAAWGNWVPVLTGVHPAAEADLALVTRRSREVLDRQFTATAVGAFGSYELAQGTERIRVRFGTPASPRMEVYADRSAIESHEPGRLLTVPVTVCISAESACVTVTGKEEPGDRPHLFDTVTDSLLYLASGAMTRQRAAQDLLESVRGQGVPLGTGTVDSPLGELSCLVVVEGPDDLAGLDGATLAPGEREAEHGELCVDSRGLVVLSPGDLFSPVTPYTSLDTTPPTGLDHYPYPVRPYRS